MTDITPEFIYSLETISGLGIGEDALGAGLLDTVSMEDLNAQGHAPDESLILYKRQDSDEYLVSLDVSSPITLNPHFYGWLSSLPKSSRVKFFLSNTGLSGGPSPANQPKYLECFAPLIYTLFEKSNLRFTLILDHWANGIESYFALAFDSSCIEHRDTGALFFEPPTCLEDSPMGRSIRPFLDFLYESGLKNHILTKEDVDKLKNGELLYLSPKTLKERLAE